LDSLVNQDINIPNGLSVLIADDGSTDETLGLVSKDLQGRFTVAVAESWTHVGERANVNRALDDLKVSGTEWVLILHSDDIAKSSWLSTMLSRIDLCDDRVGTICSSWDTLLPDGTVIPGEDDASRSVERIAGGVEAVRNSLRKGCWWHISGCAIRMQTVHEVGVFEPDMAQTGDWEWLLRCLKRGWAVEYIPRTLIEYRQHSRSVSSNSFRKSRDIIESLGIVRKYSDLMSAQELLNFHLRRQRFVILRIGRALIEFRFRRVVHLVAVMGRIGLSFFCCIARAPA